MSTAPEALHGDGSRASVVAANRCADTIATLLLPVIEWLGLEYIFERPVPCQKRITINSFCNEVDAIMSMSLGPVYRQTSGDKSYGSMACPP